MKFQVALLAGLLAATPAFAQNGPTTASGDRGGNGASSEAPQASGNADSERRICRVAPGSTESTGRMQSRRVCKTAAEWRQIRNEE